jgi:hypothetical protein
VIGESFIVGMYRDLVALSDKFSSDEFKRERHLYCPLHNLRNACGFFTALGLAEQEASLLDS